MAEKGRNVIIKANGTAIAGTRSNKLQVSCDTIEISSPNSGQWREFIAGCKDWSMSVSWLLVSGNSISGNVLTVGNTYTLRFGTRTDYVEGQAICTKCDVDANIDNLVQGTFQFKGSGALT